MQLKTSRGKVILYSKSQLSFFPLTPMVVCVLVLLHTSQQMIFYHWIKRLMQVPSRFVKVTEVLHKENKKTVVALNSNPPSPADREGPNSHDSLHSVCVQGWRLSDVWPCGLGSVWAGCVDLHLHPSRFILRWQKTHSVRLKRVILCLVLPAWNVDRSN